MNKTIYFKEFLNQLNLLYIYIYLYLQQIWAYELMCHIIGYYRSGFVTLPPMLLQEQPAVIFLLERGLVSWSLAMDEHGGHQDLCGSGHRSVIPDVHGRIELYCSSLTLLV
jgi:hypothetical protein